VVGALRLAGASVVPLVSTGGSPDRRGLPDLLVGYRGWTVLIEVKDSEGKLRESQHEWARRWRGCPPLVVRSAHEALSALGMAAPAETETAPGHGARAPRASRSASAEEPTEHREQSDDYEHDE
jgi:Holliday junction resolvase